MRKILLPTVLLFAWTAVAAGASILVEAEGFADRGGWLIDQQSMDVMGSPYLLAHGLGVPVADAETTVTVPEAGEYRVFVNHFARHCASDPTRFSVAITYGGRTRKKSGRISDGQPRMLVHTFRHR